MNDVEAVDMSKAFENLTKETPDFLALPRQVARYQIAKGLSSDQPQPQRGGM